MREEGDKGHTRMIPGEGGRGEGMRGGAASCPTARRCPGGAPKTACSPDLLRPGRNPQKSLGTDEMELVSWQWTRSDNRTWLQLPRKVAPVNPSSSLPARTANRFFIITPRLLYSHDSANLTRVGWEILGAATLGLPPRNVKGLKIVRWHERHCFLFPDTYRLRVLSLGTVVQIKHSFLLQ
jgi:hypothetical protein